MGILTPEREQELRDLATRLGCTNAHKHHPSCSFPECACSCKLSGLIQDCKCIGCAFRTLFEELDAVRKNVEQLEVNIDQYDEKLGTLRAQLLERNY